MLIRPALTAVRVALAAAGAVFLAHLIGMLDHKLRATPDNAPSCAATFTSA